MDAQTFLAEFAHIANAPGGIDQMRQMIYQLAVTGALTPRSEKGEDARVLLESIGVRRQALIREKKYKRMVELEGEAIATPFGITLPSAWCWSRLLDVGEINPRNHADEDVKAAFLPMSGVPQVHRGGLVADTAKWGDIKKGYTHFASGDVVLAKITPCFENGKAAVIEALPAGCAIGAGTTELHVFRPIHAGVLPEYVYLFLRSPLFAAKGVKSMTGTAGQKRLPTDFFATRAFPLPPAEEQSRIVAKVDELMALCDKLEAKQQARRKLQNNLRQSALHAVVSAINPQELHIAWTRFVDSFGRIFHGPEDVADLRKMLSELAIRGALDAPSESKDTSEVERYLAKLARKKLGKRFAKSIGAEQELVLPNGWSWVLLEDLLADSEAGWSPKCDAERRRNGEWGVLKVSAVTWGVFNPEENKRLPPSLEARQEYEVRPGDFMLSRANTAELVARSVIAPMDCPEKLLMSDKIVRLVFLDERLKPWVNLVNNSELSRSYYKDRATGTSDSMRNVSRQLIHELPIPFPSLKVQKRILKALDHLMGLCNELERQESFRVELSTQLSVATVSSITGMTIEQEEESMKTPQTELIAPLRLGKPPGVRAQAPLATILARHKGEMSARDLWQRFTGEIDAFYAQLKTEVANGWILEPGVAEMREKASEDAGS